MSREGIPAFRVVAYNFLAGGSRNRAGHWSRVIRRLRADMVLAQECRRPAESASESFRPTAADALHWERASRAGWGSAVFARSATLRPIEVPGFGGWIVGGALESASWLNGRQLRVFSVHGPAGEHGYIRTMHAILDRIALLAADSDLILGGDFNVVVGYRQPRERLKVMRGEREILERLSAQLKLMSCWQAAHPGRPLQQTLRWTADRKAPYHCDGIFVPESWRDRLVACRIVRGRRWAALSDHNPVLAEFAAAAG
jgi:endonuclease/exonuclease/phosphatase family metal-dependent hydrolase